LNTTLSIMAKGSFISFVCDQFTRVPPVLHTDLSARTVVVVGANVGLGLEATKHFATMKPARLILVCRSEEKGKTAIKDIETATGYSKAELYLVDLSSFASVDSLGAKFEQEGLTLDILVYNAGILMDKHEHTSDGWEPTLQVNALSAMLLSVLLVPSLLRAASVRTESHPRLVIVGSAVHYMAKFPKEILNSPDVLRKLNEPEFFGSGITMTRYYQSKLLSLQIVRALADHLAHTPIIPVNPNPGYCYSGLRRNLSPFAAALDKLMEKLLARTTEQGSRDLVFAAIGGEDGLRGAYTNLASVAEPSDFVLSEAGQDMQKRAWAESVEILSAVSPAFKDIVDTHLSS